MPSMPEIPFFGLAPSRDPVGTTPGSVPGDAKSANSHIDDIDLESATASAMTEWNSIMAAFKTFTDALGPDFHPIPVNASFADVTPFGNVIVFRNPAVACMWSWYHMAIIVTMRFHPLMPPFATMAVGRAAEKTQQHAIQIGRIVSGISPDLRRQPIDPALAGAFTDSSIPLFFAGVQYMDADQRRWTIRRLRDVERTSGWASVGLCAKGCETMWEKAAAMGRGPPYEPTYTNMKFAQEFEDAERDHLPAPPPLTVSEADGQKFSPLFTGGQVSWAASPCIAQPMPWLLRLGFPVPLTVSGTGLAPGDTRTIRFSGVEGHAPGNLRLQVTAAGLALQRCA